MKVVILTHSEERHYFFINNIINNIENVVGIVTGGKKKYGNKNNIFKKLPKILQELRYRQYRLKLKKEKDSTEILYFQGNKNEFYNNAKINSLLHVQSPLTSINDEKVVKWIRKLKPDIIVVMGTCLVGKSIINSADHILNLHTGLSPYYRGGKTNLWPIIQNDYGFFGVTVHRMSTGIDSGDICYSERVIVEQGDTYSSINCKAIVTGCKLMIQTINNIKTNKHKAIPQWVKGKLFLNKHYNGRVAKYYFELVNNFMNKHIKLQNEQNLPKIKLVINGEIETTK